MEALRVLRAKTALNVVIDSQVALDHVCKVTYNLICILVEQALKLGHFLIVIEVLFVLGVQLDEDRLVML